MLEIKTIADLQKLIQDEIEESTVLEYKSSFAIQNKKWKEELAKDVSALANSFTFAPGITKAKVG